MKTKNLLSYSWRPYGWTLLIICLPLSSWFLFGGEENVLVTKVQPLFTVSSEIMLKLPFLTDGRDDKTGWTQSPFDEFLYIGLISDLVIIGFSRLKVEDERVALIRLEALQWGIYANCLALLITIIFVYDTNFLVATIYNMFTPLLIFVARFYWLLHIKPALDAKKEKSLI